MIKVPLTNAILARITAIDENRFSVGSARLSVATANRLRKNTKKKSSYASNKIEGNPLTEAQAYAAIEADPHRHFIKPEQEIRNYYLALDYLEVKAGEDAPFTKELILKVQSLVEKGAPKEKIGLRGAMPPGYLFAVYDSVTGEPEYIPPEYSEVPVLLDELVEYVNTTDDHPLIVSAVVHYQLVTIHPFEDGNGRTARLMSGYVLETRGYGFNGIGTPDEYYAYDTDEYYRSLQMGLPALYYSGRNDPPHPEIWIDYFLRMIELYSDKAREISRSFSEDDIYVGLSHLRRGEKELLAYLIEKLCFEFTPVEMSKRTGVTNKTIINRCVALAANGYIVPVIAKERIRSYRLSDFTVANKEELAKALEE